MPARCHIKQKQVDDDCHDKAMSSVSSGWRAVSLVRRLFCNRLFYHAVFYWYHNPPPTLTTRALHNLRYIERVSWPFRQQIRHTCMSRFVYYFLFIVNFAVVSESREVFINCSFKILQRVFFISCSNRCVDPYFVTVVSFFKPRAILWVLVTFSL